jgi:hypothetical protein
MLPDYEVDTFLDLVSIAQDMARRGHADDGCEVLILGWQRAREIENEPWAEELVRRYQQAVKQFVETHPIRRS